MIGEGPKCSNCKFARLYPQDMSNRICGGAPPQLVTMPTQQGIQMQYHWPIVTADTEGCSLYKPKLTLDSPEGNA